MKKPISLKVVLMSACIGLPSISLSNTMPGDLPNLGNTASGIISTQQEYEIGQSYLKYLRSRTLMVSDPEIKDYLERMIYRLAQYSDLSDHRLNPLIIDSPTLNAFAAPGGIIGVNSGLFFHANTEAQFAGVLAHELSHLSQHHYARNVEDAKNKSLPTAAAVIASIIIMASGGGDVGMAALVSTMGGIQSSQLRFSRQFELEADRIGIQTLAKAGFDPQAMPEMFELMSKSSRYQSKPPEFLLTHPVTENRIADAKARVAQLPKKGIKDSLDYQFTRMRLIVISAEDPSQSARQLETELKTDHTTSADITQYGLALSHLRAKQYAPAGKSLAPLLKKAPQNLHLILAQSELEAETGQLEQALERINKALSIHIDHYPLLAKKADILVKKKEFQSAKDILLKLSRTRQNDPDVWYNLAEVQGQAQDILGLHQSRAEFFFLVGNSDDALKHLEYALKKVGNNYVLRAKIDKRIRDIQNHIKGLKNS